MNNEMIKPNDTVPVFNLQLHHDKVSVPREFDLRDLAKKHLIFPLKVISLNGHKKLLLAMVNPFDHTAISDVQFRSGLPVVPVQADRVDVKWLMQVHYFGRKLSPIATIDDGIMHDVFSQLELTTNEQARPEWVEDSLGAYQIKDKA